MIYTYTQFLNEANRIKNSPNLPDEYPKLYDAIHQGNVEWVRAIVEKGIDVNLIMYHKTPLLHAAIYSRKFPEKMCEIVQILLDAGADIDFRRTDKDSTALLSAIKFVDIRN